MHVRGGTHLEWHPPVAHVVGERAQNRPRLGDLYVVHDAYAMAETFCTAPAQGLGDGREPECLAGVDRRVEVSPADAVEGVHVTTGWVTGLRAGDVETDHPVMTVPKRQLCDLRGPRGGAHGGHEEPDHHRRSVRSGRHLALGEALQDRHHDVVELHSGFGAQLGCHPHLGIDHAIGREVLHALARHPADRFGVLHHADGVREGLQVELQIAAVGPSAHQ